MRPEILRVPYEHLPHESRSDFPNLLELAVVAGHHINPGEPPDFSSCFGDHSLAVTAFQIRGRVSDDVGFNEMGGGRHRAILRRASCRLLRGKTAISEEFARNLLSAGPDAQAYRLAPGTRDVRVRVGGGSVHGSLPF
jgi:hypothetical protein